MRAKCSFVFFAILVILVTGFIFSNSLKVPEESNEQSEKVMDIVRPVLVPNLIHEETEDETEHELSFLVRKAAHFIEFAALGVCVGGMFASLPVLKKKRYILFPAILCASIACCDEWIQSFSDRTSSLKDVALDSCGSICGLLFVAGVVWLLNQRRGGKPYV